MDTSGSNTVPQIMTTEGETKGLAERLRALLAKATPLPWAIHRKQDNSAWTDSVAVGPADHEYTALFHTTRGSHSYEHGDHGQVISHTAELVVEGLNALPALLDALTAAQAALAESAAKRANLLKAEHDLSASYVRVRQHIGALNGAPVLIEPEELWAFVEGKAKELADRAEEAERKLAASKPRVLALVGNWLGHNIYVARTEAGGIAFYDTTCGPVAEILDMTVADPDIIRMCLLMLPHLEKNGLPGEKSPRTAPNGILHRTTQGIEP